ncbi:MAG: insulinase family protein [Pseudomonadota bacterium]
MTTTHGFELQREQHILELNSTARIYRHLRTGARLLSVLNDDENKVFGVSFRTPAQDSTGVAHILEHSVLCGSDRYPTKEPFVELLKGSLQTFLNAMTYPDKTCYPVASANLQDFYNLVDVYLDAVFHPRLTPMTLMQEGWHHEVDDDGTLSYKGVVFNEMKGVYSSPDSLLAQLSQQVLFPDTTYGLESGGDPRHIPELSWKAFSTFHRTLYHPSNSYSFYYGDDPEERRLQILDAVFSGFDALSVDTAVPLQRPFAEPRQLTAPYVASDDSGKALFTLGAVVGETADAHRNLAWQILEHVLIGLPSSPLRKALTDSGLGEDLCGAGLEGDLRQLYFSVGLRGIAVEDVDRAEDLIHDTLQQLVTQGIPAADIEAALNSIEFHLREQNTGSYPRGLSMMMEALCSWLHDGDPLALLPFEDSLGTLRQRLASGERVFEDMLQRDILDNPHCARVTLVPDRELGARQEAEERARLDAARAQLDDAALQQLRAGAEALQQRQEAPDRPEDLATIPRLGVADMPLRNVPIPVDTRSHAGVPVLCHPLNTRGIVYLDLGFDLRALPDALLPLGGLLGRALTEMGTHRTDFVALMQRIASRTGGIDPRLLISARHDDSSPLARLLLRGKATIDQVEELCALMGEMILEPRLDDAERFSQIALESKARREESLIPSGHQAAATRLRARRGEAGTYAERMHGVESVFFVRQLLERCTENDASVQRDLEMVHQHVVRREGAIANLTADEANLPRALAALEGLIDALPSRDLSGVTRTLLDSPLREGLALPSQVHYVGCGGDAYAAGYRYSGAAHVVSRYLSTTYLWDRVRVQGGAYGAFCMFDRLSGHLGFVSYRDPNTTRTVEAFRGAAAYLRDNPPVEEEMHKAIVGAIGEIDRYMLPDQKGFSSLARHLTGEDEDFRQRVREQVLGTTAKDFVDFAVAAQAVADQGDLCVVGDEASLSNSGLELQITKVL